MGSRCLRSPEPIRSACRATAAPTTPRWYQERSAPEPFAACRARRSARAASISAAISSSLIDAAPAASSAGATASSRSSALRFLALVARNSTKSSTSATCCGESVLIFDIKFCSTVALIVTLLGFGASERQGLQLLPGEESIEQLLDHVLVPVGRLLDLLTVLEVARYAIELMRNELPGGNRLVPVPTCL